MTGRLPLPVSMPDSADNSAPQPTLSSEDQSTFEQWRLTFGVITGLGVTADERKAELERHQWRTCERWKRYLMNYSQSLLHYIAAAEIAHYAKP